MHEVSLLTTGGFWVATTTGFARKFTANEKLNLGVVGTINRAGANISALRDQMQLPDAVQDVRVENGEVVLLLR